MTDPAEIIEIYAHELKQLKDAVANQPFYTQRSGAYQSEQTHCRYCDSVLDECEPYDECQHEEGCALMLALQITSLKDRLRHSLVS